MTIRSASTVDLLDSVECCIYKYCIIFTLRSCSSLLHAALWVLCRLQTDDYFVEVLKLLSPGPNEKLIKVTICLQVDAVAEGEAQRYFDHAITLRDTIRFLRHNKELVTDVDQNNTKAASGQSVDLLRCESLLGLDSATCTRVLNKNYTYVGYIFFGFCVGGALFCAS